MLVTSTSVISSQGENFGFINIKILAPRATVEARYNTRWNFTGTRIPGYRKNVCLLTKAAAQNIARVQKELELKGYSLLIFDCYRPMIAVNYFVKWANNLKKQKMKHIFYPGINKSQLVPEYISNCSSHSRGSTLDLTLIRKPKYLTKNIKHLHYKEPASDCRKTNSIETTGQVNMGTSFDCFSPLSHTFNSDVSKQHLANREILKSAMEKHGFKNYSKEWWHFTLKNEPYRNRYFNFEVY